MQWHTLDDLNRDTLRVSAQLPPNLCGVIGIPRSGMIPATILAAIHDVPLYEIHETFGLRKLGQGTRGGYRPSDGVLALVDDSLHSGLRMRTIFDHVRELRVVKAAVYVSPERAAEVDIVGRLADSPHLFAWHFFNSGFIDGSIGVPGFAGGCALDMDGVICHDCPERDDDDDQRYASWLAHVKPLYLPRKTTVPLIVTARLEKYRGATEAWLDRHGVRCGRLMMGPWRDKYERHDNYRAGEFKGNAFRESGCAMFVESCPAQAAQIAIATGRRVLCPTNGEVFT